MSDSEINNEPAESADEQLIIWTVETESVSSSSDSGISYKKFTQIFLKHRHFFVSRR